jgi:opacity protein-like surface antigen
MRKSVSFGLAGIFCAAASTNVALAADANLPVKAPIAAPVVYNWTGVYAGVHAGYGGGMKDWFSSLFDYAAHGFLGGGQVGINQQIGNLVIGIEADASWANIKGGQTLSIGGPFSGTRQVGTADSHIDGLVTIAGRLGWAADRWLVYVKGGGVWANENHSVGVQTTNFFGFPGGGGVAVSTTAASGTEKRFGGVLGFGAEYAFLGNWSAKIEYNYLALGLRTVDLVGTQAGVAVPFRFASDIEQSFHLVKLGLNYRFGLARGAAGHRAGAPGVGLRLVRAVCRCAGGLWLRTRGLDRLRA